MSGQIPRGYIRLTGSYDGVPFLLDARGLFVQPGSGSVRLNGKHAQNCIVGPSVDEDQHRCVAETFDEVQALLVAALGAQEGGAS